MAQGYWQGIDRPIIIGRLSAAVSGIAATPTAVLQVTMPPLVVGSIVLVHHVVAIKI